jgi:hypothetical protein
MYYKLQLYSIHHVHYTSFICGKIFVNFEFLNVYTLNFQSFKIPHFLNCDFFIVFNRLLSSQFFTINLFLLYESLKILDKNVFNDKKNFTFKCF